MPTFSSWLGRGVPLGVAVLLAACASQAELIQRRRAMTIRVVPVAYASVLSATLNVLQDRGFVLQEVDRKSGHVRGLKIEALTLSAIGRAFSSKNRKEMNDGNTYDVSLVLTSLSEASTRVRAMIQSEPPPTPRGLQWLGKAISDAEDEDFEVYRTTVYHREVYQRLLEAIAVEAHRLAVAGGEQ